MSPRTKTLWIWLGIIVLALVLWALIVYLLVLATAYYYLKPLLELLAIFAAAFSE